jgi:methylphosphotriester-DNA--protein-cysteine methyltransferase
VASSAKPQRREEAVVDPLPLRKPAIARPGSSPALLEPARQALLQEPQAITVAKELSDIAYRVGFRDQEDMTRSVQRMTGLSPGRLRSLLS